METEFERGNQGSARYNQFRQPVGRPVGNWTACQVPAQEIINGDFCSLEPLSVARHGEDLCQAMLRETHPRQWTYLAYGPFDHDSDFVEWLASVENRPDPSFRVIRDLATGKVSGLASLMRIQPEMGVIEIGHIHFSPSLQRTTAATECLYLLLKQIFESWRYRRCEWKCDSLNKDSRAAAERLGFAFEGIFRQACVYKGRNRDTAWYSIVDHEWPRIATAFKSWLSAENFDEHGRQRIGLRQLIQSQKSR